MTLTHDQRLIVALDVATPIEALDLVNKLNPLVATFKIGYWLLFEPEFYTLVKHLRDLNKSIFLDAKLNDIPETVKRGVISAARHGFDFITVHSDEAMLAAAVEGAASSDIRVMAITALTSIQTAGSRDRFRAGVVNAVITACDGLIMSPADIGDRMGYLTQTTKAPGTVRDLVGDMLIATPGIRMSGESTNDHGRSGTPAQAISLGADYVIVGRSIIKDPDPVEATRRILDSMKEK